MNRSEGFPVFTAAASSDQTEMTCRAAGSMVMTVSAPVTASAVVAAILTRRAAAASQQADDEVEATHRITGLYEIAGHGAAHIAKSDKANRFGHVNPPLGTNRRGRSVSRNRSGRAYLLGGTGDDAD
jgi:hypothetical protein